MLNYFDKLKKEKKKAEAKDTAIKVATGLTVGTAIGAAAGILLAPKAGKETREDIKNKAQGAYDETIAVVQEKFNEVKEKKELLEANIKEGIENTKEALEDAKERRHNAVDSAKEGAEEVKEVFKKTSKKIEEDLKS